MDDATLHIPSDPSTGTTSYPASLNASVSLPEPQPRSSILAPGSRRERKRRLMSETSFPKVDSEYPSGFPS